MEVAAVDELDIVELAMIGAFWVLLEGRVAVCGFGLAGPTSGPDWRAKPPN